MTKAAKKTTTTASWRTLMRRAENMKLPKAERMQLREQAASLRRAERKAVKKPKREIGKTFGINSPRWQEVSPAEAPGRGEIVGGEVSKLADKLVALARKKGGTDAVQTELARLISTARYEGQKAADDRFVKVVKDIHERTTDKIVCSAIAAFEAQMKEQGSLPPAVTISSYTLCRMLDALNHAGYTAKGKK